MIEYQEVRIKSYNFIQWNAGCFCGIRARFFSWDCWAREREGQQEKDEFSDPGILVGSDCGD